MIREKIRSLTAGQQAPAAEHHIKSTRPRRTLSGKKLQPEVDRAPRWHEVVAAPPARAADPVAPTFVTVVTPAPPASAASRRQRRAAERATWQANAAIERSELPPVEDDDDIQYPLQARVQRRRKAAADRRRQRKGQAAYVRDYLAKQQEQATLQGQVAVLKAGRDASPARYDNVVAHLEERFGDGAVEGFLAEEK